MNRNHCWYCHGLSSLRTCFLCCTHPNQQCSCLKSIVYSALLFLICFCKLVDSMCYMWLVICLIIVMSRDWRYCAHLLFVGQSKLSHRFFLLICELSQFFCCVNLGRQFLLVILVLTSLTISTAITTILATIVTSLSTTPISAPKTWDVPGLISTIVCCQNCTSSQMLLENLLVDYWLSYRICWSDCCTLG